MEFFGVGASECPAGVKSNASAMKSLNEMKLNLVIPYLQLHHSKSFARHDPRFDKRAAHNVIASKSETTEF